jgi:hypothetical protein
MNISTFYSDGSVYINCEQIKGFAFNNAASRAERANLPVICSNSDLLRDICVHFSPFECLLPHISPA